jgi:ABC-type sugar transport system ATPase subunit
VGVRPEDLCMSTGAPGVAARVDLVEPLGNETLVHWSSALGALVSRITTGNVPVPGAEAQLSARPDGLLLFDVTSGVALPVPSELVAAH